MILDSIPLMTAFDCLTVGIAGWAACFFIRNASNIHAAKAKGGVIAILCGVCIWGVFYLSDFFTMHVLPMLVPMSQAMAYMQYLHLDLIWFVNATGMICVVLGLLSVTQCLLRSREEAVRAKIILRDQRDVLEREVAMATAGLKAKTQDLKIALAREQELNRQQRRFVSTASHEFRTPLAIIDASVQRILRHKEEISPKDLEKRATKIRSAVKTMTNLIESTLAVARFEAGKAELKITDCDLRAILLEICTRHLELNPAHKIVCMLQDLPDGIRGDPTALEQVFNNLVSNALKYSPDGPEVAVKGWTEGNDVFVSVRDQGLGIDEADLPHMFSRFFRAGTSAGIPGTGIGLNLVRTLIELHDGLIKVESRKDEGSTFTVRLPISGPCLKAPKQEVTDFCAA